MEILHGFNLRVGRGQSLCLIGPNGAGKSTVLHSIFGFTNIFSGSISTSATACSTSRPVPQREAADARHRLHPAGQVGVSGHDGRGEPVDGRLSPGSPANARNAAERVFDGYPRCRGAPPASGKARRGGERRLLEIRRALVMDPTALLVDEPRSGSSRASSTWSSTSWAISSTRMARPS